ncbi:hypothetical protein AVEN_261554-1 [Araneus ventricosus]|uniref:Uncharacterized protein n=1 Tax=Araneus ventricosus TaxID=182803 RepID=A0A4Y2JX12_ARAVE|nr:hypothetical protein AVEN_261554-1 [Araneus ventricosus]
MFPNYSKSDIFLGSSFFPKILPLNSNTSFLSADITMVRNIAMKLFIICEVTDEMKDKTYYQQHCPLGETLLPMNTAVMDLCEQFFNHMGDQRRSKNLQAGFVNPDKF